MPWEEEPLQHAAAVFAAGRKLNIPVPQQGGDGDGKKIHRQRECVVGLTGGWL